MKKLLVILLAISFLSSCSEDDAIIEDCIQSVEFIDITISDV